MGKKGGGGDIVMRAGVGGWIVFNPSGQECPLDAAADQCAVSLLLNLSVSLGCCSSCPSVGADQRVYSWKYNLGSMLTSG